MRRENFSYFVPLVFSKSGGMGLLCIMFVDHISEMIADHKKEAKSQVLKKCVSRAKRAVLLVL